jgi:hypothetical protein
MPDPDAVRRLLEGAIDPVEIEGDAALYTMAERIYGREVLEEMGVLAPQIGIEEIVSPGLMPDDISLPDFIPLLSGTKNGNVKNNGRIRKIPLLLGLLGTFGTLINIIIGGGYILCSVGFADMPYICNPDSGNFKLVVENGYTWEKLHTTAAWTQPMEFGIADATMLGVSIVLVIIGLFFRKKSVHSGDEASLGS